jgi:hypothetical protein
MANNNDPVYAQMTPVFQSNNYYANDQQLNAYALPPQLIQTLLSQPHLIQSILSQSQQTQASSQQQLFQQPQFYQPQLQQQLNLSQTTIQPQQQLQSTQSTTQLQQQTQCPSSAQHEAAYVSDDNDSNDIENIENVEPQLANRRRNFRRTTKKSNKPKKRCKYPDFPIPFPFPAHRLDDTLLTNLADINYRPHARERRDIIYALFNETKKYTGYVFFFYSLSSESNKLVFKIKLKS